MNNYDLLLPGSFYHIYNRGNNKENLFVEERNYFHFLRLWNKYVGPVADTYVYALLKNHFHLLVKVKEVAPPQETFTRVKPVHRCFADFFNAYSKSFNNAYNRCGSLFQERFKRKLIDNDAYFTELIFYIHGNPQRHGLIKNFEAYPYSSYTTILSDRPTKLKRDEVLNWFGGREGFIEYHRSYRDLLLEKTLLFDRAGDDV